MVMKDSVVYSLLSCPARYTCLPIRENNHRPFDKLIEEIEKPEEGVP
jgi:hypothetical protein